MPRSRPSIELQDVDTLDDAIELSRENFPQLEFSRTFRAAYDSEVRAMTVPLITPADAFAAALRGHRAAVHGLGDIRRRFRPIGGGSRRTRGTKALLSRCRGATVDIGCGPGRMT